MLEAAAAEITLSFMLIALPSWGSTVDICAASCILVLGGRSNFVFVLNVFYWYLAVSKVFMSDIDMGRVTVMLPADTIRQIDEWAVAAGLKRGQFTSVALVIGARILARQMSPEAFMNAEAWRGMSEAMGITPEQAQMVVKKSSGRS